MDIKPLKRKGYTYIYWNNQYQLYILSEEDYKSAYILYNKNQQDLMTLLETKYNAILKPEGIHHMLYTVWFKTTKEADKAIEYLNSRLLMKKLEGRI